MRRSLVLAIASSAALTVATLASCRRDEPPSPPRPVTLVPPLHDAKVGEWIRLVANNGADAQRMKIVEETDFDVTVETVKWHDGEPTQPSTQKWSRNAFSIPADAVVRKIEADRIEVGGKWYDCWRLELHSHVRELVYWVTPEVPVNGVLKIAGVRKGIVDDLNAATLAEFDWGEAPEKGR